jgi:hypothetical protein
MRGGTPPSLRFCLVPISQDGWSESGRYRRLEGHNNLATTHICAKMEQEHLTPVVTKVTALISGEVTNGI